MKITDFDQIKSSLANVCNLEECQIDSITFEDAATTITLVLNYIWEKKGVLRRDISKEPLYVSLRFYLVESFVLKNQINAKILKQPDMLPQCAEAEWVELDDSFLSKEQSADLHRARIDFWDEHHYMEIVFRKFEIVGPKKHA